MRVLVNHTWRADVALPRTIHTGDIRLDSLLRYAPDDPSLAILCEYQTMLESTRSGPYYKDNLEGIVMDRHLPRGWVKGVPIYCYNDMPRGHFFICTRDEILDVVYR